MMTVKADMVIEVRTAVSIAGLQDLPVREPEHCSEMAIVHIAKRFYQREVVIRMQVMLAPEVFRADPIASFRVCASSRTFWLFAM